MILILGAVVVMGCVLGGFTMAGGHVAHLIHPSEIVTIGGASLGAAIMMSPKKVLIDLVKAVIGALKGSPYNKQLYRELFKASYELLRKARRDGLLSLEADVSTPHESALFKKYPKLHANHHALEFFCGGLSPYVDGTATPAQIEPLLEAELKVLEEEHHAPITVLSKTADALPGFGIVAAVLGIVITMGAIDGPVEEIGHKVGAALVGTFLGILASYGFFAPLASRMEFLGAEEMAFFRTITSIILGFANDYPPKVAIEQARRGVGTEVRPGFAEMNEIFKEVEAGA